jgi:hypothetical protein
MLHARADPTPEEALKRDELDLVVQINGTGCVKIKVAASASAGNENIKKGVAEKCSAPTFMRINIPFIG